MTFEWADTSQLLSGRISRKLYIYTHTHTRNIIQDLLVWEEFEDLYIQVYEQPVVLLSNQDRATRYFLDYRAASLLPLSLAWHWRAD